MKWEERTCTVEEVGEALRKMISELGVSLKDDNNQ